MPRVYQHHVNLFGSGYAGLSIFLPSFIFVAIVNPFIPRLRASPWASGLWDGVTASSLGLMAAVTWQLGGVSLIDPLTIGIALIALFSLVKFKAKSTWLIAGGVLIGLLHAWLR